MASANARALLNQLTANLKALEGALIALEGENNTLVDSNISLKRDNNDKGKEKDICNDLNTTLSDVNRKCMEEKLTEKKDCNDLNTTLYDVNRKCMEEKHMEKKSCNDLNTTLYDANRACLSEKKACMDSQNTTGAMAMANMLPGPPPRR